LDNLWVLSLFLRKMDIGCFDFKRGRSCRPVDDGESLEQVGEYGSYQGGRGRGVCVVGGAGGRRRDVTHGRCGAQSTRGTDLRGLCGSSPRNPDTNTDLFVVVSSGTFPTEDDVLALTKLGRCTPNYPFLKELLSPYNSCSPFTDSPSQHVLKDFVALIHNG